MRLLLLSLLLATGASAQGTGTLAGRVTEPDGVTSVIGATVRIDGTRFGARTDIDGDYRIIGVPVGTYSVSASFVGLENQTITGVEVAADTTRQLTFALVAGESTDCFIGCCFQAPLISMDAYGSRTTVDAGLGMGIDRANTLEPCDCEFSSFSAR